MKVRIYIVLIISVLIGSCGEYEKLLKSSDYELEENQGKRIL